MGHSTEINLYQPGGSAADLLCPRCGANNLHHEGIDVFHRREDHEKEVVTRVVGGSSKTEIVDAKGSGNPSMRRDGIVVHFSCEQCGDDIQLGIGQHKGSTEIAWLFADAAS